MGRVDGKVALITGGARGQGRSHALRLAEEGADIVLIDACAPMSAVGDSYPFPTVDDLKDTAAEVEQLDRRVIARQVDVRDSPALRDVVVETCDAFGGIDILCANAGVQTFGRSWELSDAEWQQVIDINLTGVWRSVTAAIPSMIERNRGGSIVLTSSVAGMKGLENLGHYVAAKHGVLGLMKTLANELGPHGVRVNAVLPGSVDTPIANNPRVAQLFRPDLAEPTPDDLADGLSMLTSLPVSWIEPVDISNAVLWLASDEARYVTGQSIAVDGGWSTR